MVNGDELARTYVAAGAAWLDARYPWWASYIDVPRLDLTKADRCVFGQVDAVLTKDTGDFARFRDKHDLTIEECMTLGVYGTPGSPRRHLLDGPWMANNAMLSTYWRELIVGRRLAASPSDVLFEAAHGIPVVI